MLQGHGAYSTIIMLHKYDLFITVVGCIILIYLHGANVKCFR